MLVVSRKNQESVVVGKAGDFERLLEVKVLEINGDKVRLGFEVEPGTPVQRREEWEGIRAAAGETS